MKSWAQKRVSELEREELSGFVFKSKSPSSGMERVKLYDANGVPNKHGVGLFAQAFMAHFPLLPVEEEGRLHDPRLRENFIEIIFTLKRWRAILSRGIFELIISDCVMAFQSIIGSSAAARFDSMIAPESVINMFSS